MWIRGLSCAWLLLSKKSPPPCVRRQDILQLISPCWFNVHVCCYMYSQYAHQYWIHIINWLWSFDLPYNWRHGGGCGHDCGIGVPSFPCGPHHSRKVRGPTFKWCVICTGGEDWDNIGTYCTKHLYWKLLILFVLLNMNCKPTLYLKLLVLFVLLNTICKAHV